jgi:putative ATPase
MHLDNGCESGASVSSQLPAQRLPSSSPPLKQTQLPGQKEISSSITKNPLFQPAVKAMSIKASSASPSFFTTKKAPSQSGGAKRALIAINSDNEDESAFAKDGSPLSKISAENTSKNSMTVNQNGNAPKRQKRRNNKNKPLAELIRPSTLEEYIGQQDLVGPRGILRAFIERDTCPSIILWGPSGVSINHSKKKKKKKKIKYHALTTFIHFQVGKTTIARVSLH